MRDVVTFDVFTRTASAGSSLPFVLEADGLSADQMRRIAREMNLSETFFVRRPADLLLQKGNPFGGHRTIGCAVRPASLSSKSSGQNLPIRLKKVAGLVEAEIRCEESCASGPSRRRPPDLSGEGLDLAGAAPAFGLAAEDVGNAVAETPKSGIGGHPYLIGPIASLSALEAAQPREPDCKPWPKRPDSGAPGSTFERWSASSARGCSRPAAECTRT